MQRFFGDLALIGRVQVEELTASMGHAADLCDAQIKARLVTGEVVADQLAVPVVQEGSGVFAGAARAEVVNDCRQVGELAGCVGPNVGSVGLLGARRQHLYRRFIGVDHAMLEHCFAQRIHQWL
ncbi:hypothetical protein D3C79_959030 [compost metagenome]